MRCQFPLLRLLRLAAAGLAVLAGCGTEVPRVVLDLQSLLPALERRSEAGRVALARPSESIAILDGFDDPSREGSGTAFRRVSGGRASLKLWLFRDGPWTLKLRYRARPGQGLCHVRLNGAEALTLPPAPDWTERLAHLAPDQIRPGANFLELRPAEHTALDLDWIELRQRGGLVTRERAAEPVPMEPVQPANSEWTAYGEVPIGARRSELRFRVRAEQAPLRLSILVSGECWKPPLSIDRRLDPGEASAEFRLPIPGTGAFRLRTTVVALAADEGGRVRWEQARALSWGAAATPTPPPRPARVLPPRDLFLIVLDAARADHLGVYGYPRRTSPWIDALAREGFVVELARAPAPYTQASTASLMTGLEPETHDVRAVRSRLSDRAVTLAEALASAGYSTSALVGNANADRPFGFAQGFELFAGGRHDRALSRLEERLKSHERNFFYIHLFPPHHPYLPPPPFGGVYSRLFPGLVNGTSEELVRIRRSGRPPPAEEVSRLIAQYDENLLYADHLLGEILGVAARLGRLRDALVILLADHGEAFFERGTPLHGYSVHDEEIRIPMILRPPHASGLAPRVLSALAGTEDVLPTVLDLCGVPDPAPLRHGRSLLPLLQGRGSGEPDAYARAQGAQLIAALAGPRWKLHHLESRVALYDLAVDPGERHDLAEERPILAGLLRQRLIERTIRNLADGQASGLREDAVLDEETTRQLRALGYLD